MFRGATGLSIDSKGRMTVPSKHRAALTKLVIAPNPMPNECCLVVYPLDEWEAVEKNIVSQPNTKAIRRLKRIFIGEAVEYVVDAQGRVLITPELREYAGLDKKITLVGQGNKLEIWSDAAWTALHDSVDDKDAQAQYVETLEGLSF
ncbi:MAG: division/cell wall cluster transcriptional repressor MraZ [Gammaproteobacteria bacterium]|nr:MAG: division/cell wall cluster transcriptional repressor MraZ [Gammaproteobacteria bacterium]